MAPDEQSPSVVGSGDPVAVILARMEVKLDNALTEQARHATRIDKHDEKLSNHGDRIMALESSKPKNVPAWSAVAVAVLAIVASFLTPLIANR